MRYVGQLEGCPGEGGTTTPRRHILHFFQVAAGRHVARQVMVLSLQCSMPGVIDDSTAVADNTVPLPCPMVNWGRSGFSHSISRRDNDHALPARSSSRNIVLYFDVYPVLPRRSPAEIKA